MRPKAHFSRQRLKLSFIKNLAVPHFSKPLSTRTSKELELSTKEISPFSDNTLKLFHNYVSNASEEIHWIGHKEKEKVDVGPSERR